MVTKHFVFKQIGIKNQTGAVLILMVFILSLLITGYLLKILNTASNQSQQNSITNKELGDAKQALLAWAVSNSINLGQLPYPDRNGGGGYDGFSDCPPSGTAFSNPTSYALLIGKLPIFGQTTPCVGKLVGLGLGMSEYAEKRLWYAVSRNIVHQYEFASSDLNSNPIINPSIINTPTYPWLKVLDKNGKIISDRIAVVIIAPGSAIGSQNRSNTASANNFLDNFQKNGKNYSNSDYDNPDEDFIIGDQLERVNANDKSISQPYYFNDQLLFITIDELISAVNKRVAAESKWLLNAYKTKNGQYPNAADLSKNTINTNLYRSETKTSGLVPIDITDSCQCADDKSCSCNFGVIESVTMLRDSGTWNSLEDSGACKSTIKASGKECSCTGAGSCSRTYSSSSTNFTCQPNGICTHNLDSNTNNKFIYTLPSHADFFNATNNCLINQTIVECRNIGEFNIGLKEAFWFKQNLWQQYMYYISSPASNLQIGDEKNVSALLIAVGQPITSEIDIIQNRPSDSIQDYLDSLENTNTDNVFESTLKKSTPKYNDEIFIVSP